MFYKNSVYNEIINKLNLLKLQKSVLKQNYFKEKSLKVFFQKKMDIILIFNTKNKYFMWPRTAISAMECLRVLSYISSDYSTKE